MTFHATRLGVAQVCVKLVDRHVPSTCRDAISAADYGYGKREFAHLAIDFLIVAKSPGLGSTHPFVTRYALIT